MAETPIAREPAEAAKIPSIDWRRQVCLGCRPEPTLYTAIWAQRRVRLETTERVQA